MRGLGCDRFFIVTKLVDAQAQKVLLLLGVACEKFEGDGKALGAYERQGVVQEDLANNDKSNESR